MRVARWRRHPDLRAGRHLPRRPGPAAGAGELARARGRGHPAGARPAARPPTGRPRQRLHARRLHVAAWRVRRPGRSAVRRGRARPHHVRARPGRATSWPRVPRATACVGASPVPSWRWDGTWRPSSVGGARDGRGLRRRRRSVPAPTDWSRPTGWPTPAGRSCCWRRNRASAAPSPATGRCTRPSCTTPSARSTRWPQPRRPSRRSASSVTACSGGTRRRCSATRCPTAAGRCCTATGTSRPGSSTAGTRATARPGCGLCALWDTVGDQLVAGLLTPFPPVRVLPRLALNLRRAGGLDVVKTLLTPVASLGNQLFGGDHPRLLLVRQRRPRRHPAGRPRLRPDGHADVDARPDGRLPRTCRRSRGAGRRAGRPVHQPRWRDPGLERGRQGAGRSRPRGRRPHRRRRGAARAARRRRRRRREPPVRRSGAARGPAGAEPCGRCGASSWTRRRSRWTGRSTVRCRGRRRRRTTRGRCTSRTRPSRSPTRSRRSRPRHVPADPFLLVGQMSTADPTRSPVGTESLWAYTHVPQQSIDDAGGEGNGVIRGVWDDADCQRFADRMQRAARATGSRLRVEGPGPPGLGSASARGPGRQPRRRCDQRRDVTAAPAAGVPAGAGAGAEPRPRSPASSSAPRPPTPVAGCTGRPATAPRGQPSPTGAGTSVVASRSGGVVLLAVRVERRAELAHDPARGCARPGSG